MLNIEIICFSTLFYFIFLKIYEDAFLFFFYNVYDLLVFGFVFAHLTMMSIICSFMASFLLFPFFINLSILSIFPGFFFSILKFVVLLIL